jgi:hypothetical protein
MIPLPRRILILSAHSLRTRPPLGGRSIRVLLLSALLSTVALLAGTNNLDAGLIGDIGAFWQPPNIVTLKIPDGIVTGSPNNDDYTGTAQESPNKVSLAKIYNFPDALDVQFKVFDSGGTTEYVFSEIIINNTPFPWVGYSVQLGYGIGPGFVLSPNNDDLDFDFPFPSVPPAGSSAFATQLGTSEFLLFFGGQVLPGEQFAVGFSIDVPDSDNSFIPPVAKFPGGFNFTLGQFPILELDGLGLFPPPFDVFFPPQPPFPPIRPTGDPFLDPLGFPLFPPIPEPSAFILFGFGTLGLLGYAWRRRKRAATAEAGLRRQS